MKTRTLKVIAWFHFGCYLYVCTNVVIMAAREQTEKSINWGLIAILMKPTDAEDDAIIKTKFPKLLRKKRTKRVTHRNSR